jgi:hypothetical protein
MRSCCLSKLPVPETVAMRTVAFPGIFQVIAVNVGHHTAPNRTARVKLHRHRRVGFVAIPDPAPNRAAFDFVQIAFKTTRHRSSGSRIDGQDKTDAVGSPIGVGGLVDNGKRAVFGGCTSDDAAGHAHRQAIG